MLRGEKRMTHYYEGFPQSDRDEKNQDGECG